MYLLSVFFPLLGGLINTTPIARFLGHRGGSILAITCMVVAFISSCVIYYEVVFMGCAVSMDVFGTWFSVGSFGAGWTLQFDILTANMLFTVTGVSMAVHMYACDYMRQDPHLNLFLGYLSFFTGFMCVLVAADNLLVMLVGWEGKINYCPNDNYLTQSVLINKRFFFTKRIPAVKRHGLHTSLFKQILLGFMLGDGWLEKHGQGVRLGISLTERFADVAKWYLLLLYGLGYTDRLELGSPLKRKKANAAPYYQLRTFSFESFMPFYNLWYKTDISKLTKIIKILPCYEYLFELLTPLTLAIWVMGDGSGMHHGSFKLCSHSFSKEENLVLCKLLFDLYGIKTSVLRDKNNTFYIYVWKRSTPVLYALVKPYLRPSCAYKFRFVN